MVEPDLIGLFVRPLEGMGISYMITGGVASVIYGDPRFTRDVDLVLRVSEEDLEGLPSAFSPEDYYVPPGEALRREAQRTRYGHFNLIHRDTGLRADVYLAGDDPLHAWAFDRRVRIPLDDGAIWLAPIEYVVVRKLQYYRDSGSDRHIRDVAMMLALSGERVDEEALGQWVESMGLAEELAAARAFRG